MARKSKKNTKCNIRRKSKTKSFIGGENCGQYIDLTECQKHKPECLWKFQAKLCVENEILKGINF